MILIVGLGNPGRKYEKTRHNLGWRVVEALAKDLKLKWRVERKFQSEAARGKNLVLAKPVTMMNNSGAAVARLVNYFKLTPEEVWVVHDDVDLALEKLKVVKGRGSAGHKGVLSVIGQLGTVDFVRIRLGISRPHAGRRMEGGKKAIKFDTQEEMEDFVLSPFRATELDEVRRLTKKAIEAIKLALEEGIEKAMNQFN